MKYGYFDDNNKEYVITRPDTPISWGNYLGSTEYGAIITNNAGGYSFYKSAAQGRFTRFRTNSIPMDQPGRYIYLRDQETGDYWSAAWQPVGKSLDKYKTVCRHGMGYTILSSEYSLIDTEQLFFVPLDQNFECWHLKITNRDNRNRLLSLYTFVEYASNWHLWQDMVNLQYTQYILTMDVKDGMIDHGTNIFLPPQPENFEEGGQARHTFLGIAGAKVTGYETDRKTFIGPYRSYHNPFVVESGMCNGSMASGDNGCGVLQCMIELSPGECKELTVVMGIGQAGKEGKKVINQYSYAEKVHDEFKKLRNYWQERLKGMNVETPDPLFNSMMNMWSPYNCQITYAWSRAASLVYAGERDGLGYRDTVQDLLGVIHMIPDEAGKRLELMLTGQVSNGGALPVVKPFSHYPGKMKKPEEKEYRSDDCLWLFNAVPVYVKETGDVSFYHKVLPYADEGEDTVLMHLKKALLFTLERTGRHGLPCGLLADWNDCLVLGHNGETVFVAFQLRYSLKTFIDICELLNENKHKHWAEEKLVELDRNIKKIAWDGKWFLRAMREDGFKYGSHDCDEGEIWLNPQTWAVLSGFVQDNEARALLRVVYERLFTEYGLMICDPPYEKTDIEIIKATLFNKGMKENGAVFCHTQGWAVIAETLVGNGNRAFQYFKSYMPATFNDRAEVREIEPYVYCQSTHSKYSPRYGASRLSWLSGAATWAYYAATHYILGIRPEYRGLIIDPCIPQEWKNINIIRYFRGKKINITIFNPDGRQKGVRKIILNGHELKNNFIPTEQIQPMNEAEVFL